jgi:threonine/homoserine/homoserine lactone efflux protein
LLLAFLRHHSADVAVVAAVAAVAAVADVLVVAVLLGAAVLRLALSALFTALVWLGWLVTTSSGDSRHGTGHGSSRDSSSQPHHCHVHDTRRL